MKALYDIFINMNKQQMLDYCIANRVDIDAVYEVTELAESILEDSKNELRDLEECYSYEESTNSYYASDRVESRCNELENKIESIEYLRNATEDIYTELDNYYANNMYNL